jgi:hypothetical protein
MQTSNQFNPTGDTTMSINTKIALSLVLALSAVTGASAATKHPVQREVATSAYASTALGSVAVAQPGQGAINIQDRDFRETQGSPWFGNR